MISSLSSGLDPKVSSVSRPWKSASAIPPPYSRLLRPCTPLLLAGSKLGLSAALRPRDGFWLHRLLTAHGITNYVLEPTSISTNGRARRAKTDRLDAIGMLLPWCFTDF